MKLEVGDKFYWKRANSNYTIVKLMGDGKLKCEQDKSGAWIHLTEKTLLQLPEEFEITAKRLKQTEAKFFIGEKVVDITTGSRFTVISKARVNGEVECELEGTRELFLKPAENLQLLAEFKLYEKDGGGLADEQTEETRTTSSATEIPLENFTESLFKLSPEPESKEEVQSILEQRGSRYGSFYDLAMLSQDLKETMRAVPGWKKLTASQKEALDMIQHKIARMLNGDPTYEDNAVDIVGYSTLMMKNMQGDLKI